MAPVNAGIKRRHFLRVLGAAVVAIAAAPAVIASPASPITLGEPWGTSFTVGDVVTIDGVYEINPITRVETEYLRNFVVTANEHVGDKALRLHPMPPYLVTREMATPVAVGRTVPITVKWNPR